MSTPVTTVPPMLSTFDAAAFRRQLADLTDPDYSPASPQDDNATSVAHKVWAIGLCVACCDLFGDALDRLTLWDKIPASLAAAVTKCDDGDIDRLMSLVLGSIKADPSRAARHIDIESLLYEANDKPISWRQGLIRYIATHEYAIVCLSRRQWELTKEQRRDAKIYRDGGTLSSGEIVEKEGK